uniref:ABC transporter domain-containing protein n=1 Tax=Panagrellus redivivus TaxID=6233 RepID=A0A7E4W8W6_PANRE
MRLIDQIMMKNLWLGCWELAQQFMQAFFLGLQVVMCYTILFFPIIVHNNDIKDILAFITLNFSECHFLYMTIYYRYVCTIQDFFNSAGTLRRVHEFLEFADNNWKEVADDEAEIDKRVKFCSDGNEVFKFDSVCYETPISPSKVLMTDLNFTLKKGENLLVSGYSGSGKSAFLRIITRLWKIKSGTFTMGISDNEILVIPQKPYFPTGNLTLRQQIIFPKLIDDRNVSDKGNEHC